MNNLYIILAKININIFYIDIAVPVFPLLGGYFWPMYWHVQVSTEGKKLRPVTSSYDQLCNF